MWHRKQASEEDSEGGDGAVAAAIGLDSTMGGRFGTPRPHIGDAMAVNGFLECPMRRVASRR